MQSKISNLRRIRGDDPDDDRDYRRRPVRAEAVSDEAFKATGMPAPQVVAGGYLRRVDDIKRLVIDGKVEKAADLIKKDAASGPGARAAISLVDVSAAIQASGRFDRQGQAALEKFVSAVLSAQDCPANLKSDLIELPTVDAAWFRTRFMHTPVHEAYALPYAAARALGRTAAFRPEEHEFKDCDPAKLEQAGAQYAGRFNRVSDGKDVAEVGPQLARFTEATGGKFKVENYGYSKAADKVEFAKKRDSLVYAPGDAYPDEGTGIFHQCYHSAVAAKSFFSNTRPRGISRRLSRFKKTPPLSLQWPRTAARH